MNEIEKIKFLLKNLEEFNEDVSKKGKRDRKLIINIKPETEMIENLTKQMWKEATEHWYFIVKDVFKDALDIKYTPIVIGKEKYKTKTGEEKEKSITKNIWTQGGFLNFQLGDTFFNKKEDYCIMVENSRPIQYSTKLDLGYVMFFEYKIQNGKYERINILNKKVGNQLEFLEFLITGNNKIYDKANEIHNER
ncbi:MULTISPECIES: hypothetical protein [Fusobacterium]|uniref:hypothetical protein n=1 Tax=Fusobacterium TaxID=848 RepID=UPI003563C0F1